MSRPDLNDPEQLAAYRAELKAVGRPLRLGGLTLILVAALLVVGASQGWGVPETVTPFAYGALGLGWALMLSAIFLRTRHHRRRMSESA